MPSCYGSPSTQKMTASSTSTPIIKSADGKPLLLNKRRICVSVDYFATWTTTLDQIKLRSILGLCFCYNYLNFRRGYMSNRFMLWLLFLLFLPSILAAHKEASSKCAQICQSSIDPQCIQKCQNQSQQQVIKTVIATALGFILLCVLFCGCCFLQSHHKFRKLRLLFSKQYKLLKQHNQINNTVMSMKQFNQHVQHIMRLFNQGEKSQNFVRISNGAESVEKAIASVKGVQPFLCELQLEGQDNDGDWSASGAIVCTSQGVICWFYKEYDDDFTKRIKHRMGKFAYVSQPSTMNQLTGDWWRFGNSSKAEQKGQWMLKIPQNSGVQEGYEHSDMQIMN